MKLKKVQIKDFRCVEDSGEFLIDDVTCLVGKNESGKTAILKALHKLKAANDAVDDEFEPAKDYPKRKWRPDVAIPNEPPAIKTQWVLDEKDMALLESKFGENVITKNTFSLSKGYDNTRRYNRPPA